VAVLAAVSNKRGLIHFLCRHKSIKSEDYCHFLDDLKLMSGDRQLNVLLDNCQVHKSKVSRRQANELGINLIWNVPYCPQFNGIELYWAIIKQKFKKKTLAILTGIERETMIRKTVVPIMRAVPTETIVKCVMKAVFLIN